MRFPYGLTLVLLVGTIPCHALDIKGLRRLPTEKIHEQISVALEAPNVCTRSALPSVPDLASAAKLNGQNFRTLEWHLAHRIQEGWELYLPLIASYLDLDSRTPAHSEELARRISQWQETIGCRNPADGVMDAGTLMSFLLEFQDRRSSAGSEPPAEAQVLPKSLFYNPKRGPDDRKLERKTAAAYQKLLKAARKAGIKGDSLKIISGYRSPSRTTELRKRHPASNSSTLATTHSVHETGRAIDVYVGGSPVDASHSNRLKQSQSRAYHWLLMNAGRFGFIPYYYEPWHWEYVGP